MRPRERCTWSPIASRTPRRVKWWASKVTSANQAGSVGTFWGQVWIATEAVAATDMSTSWQQMSVSYARARHFQHPLTRFSLSVCLLENLVAHLVGKG